MKKFGWAAALGMMVAITPAVARAEVDVYYIELGDELNARQAEEAWLAINKKHKKILGDLKFFPQAVIKKDKGVVTRLQAGPIDSKKKAYALCRKFFRADTPCFVVEGLTEPPSGADASNVPLPWRDAPGGSQDGEVLLSSAGQPQNSQAAEEKKPESRDFFSRLFGGGDEEGKGMQKAPSEDADVEVAEAIRVPLSEEKKAPPVTAFAESSGAPAPFAVSESVTAASENAPGWLDVASFADAGAAGEIWQRVRERAPTLAAGLRVRIVQPVAKRRGRSVSLNIGPFADREDAMNFCESGIRAVDESLRCAFTRREEKITARLVAPRYQHGRAYAARRQAVSSQRALSEPSEPVYWLQVASGDTQLDALKNWEDVHAANGDLLEGLRSSVSSPLSEGARFTVRVGPIRDRDKAMNICDNLQVRGHGCRIFSNL